MTTTTEEASTWFIDRRGIPQEVGDQSIHFELAKSHAPSGTSIVDSEGKNHFAHWPIFRECTGRLVEDPFRGERDRH